MRRGNLWFLVAAPALALVGWAWYADTRANDAPPIVWRQAGRLVPGDQFEDDAGARWLVVGDGAEPIRGGPGQVVAVELGTGRLHWFDFGERVRWVIRSRQAVRDWDNERGAEPIDVGTDGKGGPGEKERRQG